MARQVSGALRQLERQPKPQNVGYLYLAITYSLAGFLALLASVAGDVMHSR